MSSASYRLRIALNLKGVPVEYAAVHLRRGDQRTSSYLAVNPQGLVPALELDDGEVLTQSLAIIEWLDEVFPEPPLLPGSPSHRARVRALAYTIAEDLHPLQNLRVLKRIRKLTGEATAAHTWAREVNMEGLTACEALLLRTDGPFCFGKTPSLADVCLIPQMANARRFGVAVDTFPRLIQAEAACLALAAFSLAAPENQPDFE